MVKIIGSDSGQNGLNSVFRGLDVQEIADSPNVS